MGFFVEHPEGWAGILQFLVLTVIMGGGGAFMAGKALASGWKSIPRLLFYMLIFTAGLRFLHYALFEGTLTSPLYFVSHGLVVMAAALLGYRTKRASQMTTQYPWLYERTGPLSWKNKA
jgi:hypothetical protein